MLHQQVVSNANTITIKLFARLKEVIGSDSIELDCEVPQTVGEIRCELVQNHADLGSLIRASLFSRSGEYCRDDDLVLPGENLAVIPPVSGG